MDVVTPLYWVAWAIYLVAWYTYVLRKLPGYRCFGLGSIAFGLWTIDAFLTGRSAVAELCFCALLGYLWWRGGGNDDSKRLGRRLAKAFSPVRRTAPQPA